MRERIFEDPTGDMTLQLPTVPIRGVAKFIDLLCVSLMVTGFGKLAGSYLVGLLAGYTWLAFADAHGSSPGKWLCRLQVVDYDTGADCTWMQSALRNWPLLALNLPPRLHRALLDLDHPAYREEYPLVVLAIGLASLGWIFWVVAYMSRDIEGRRHEDYLAGTIVCRK